MCFHYFLEIMCYTKQHPKGIYGTCIRTIYGTEYLKHIGYQKNKDIKLILDCTKNDENVKKHYHIETKE